MVTLKESQPVARKEHQCDWCGGIIHKGEKYYYSFNIWEGYPCVWESHLSCMEIVSALNMFDNSDYGVTKEDFEEFIKSEYQNIMSDHYAEEYESKGFVYPPFLEQLEFVKKFHGIK